RPLQRDVLAHEMSPRLGGQHLLPKKRQRYLRKPGRNTSRETLRIQRSSTTPEYKMITSEVRLNETAGANIGIKRLRLIQWIEAQGSRYIGFQKPLLEGLQSTRVGVLFPISIIDLRNSNRAGEWRGRQ